MRDVDVIIHKHVSHTFTQRIIIMINNVYVYVNLVRMQQQGDFDFLGMAVFANIKARAMARAIAATQYLSRLNFLNRQKPGTDASTY